MSFASLRAKIIVSLSLLSLVVVVILIIALQKLDSLNSQFEFSAQKTAPKLLLDSELESSLIALGKNEKSMLLASSRDEMNTYIERDSILLAKLDSLEKQLSPLVLAEQGGEFMHAYLEHKAAYITMRKVVLLLGEKQLSLYLKGDLPGAYAKTIEGQKLSFGRVRELSEQAGFDLKRSIDFNRSLLADQQKESLNSYHEARNYLFVLLGLFLLLSLLILMSLLRILGRRVEFLTHRAEQAISGAFIVFNESVEVDDELRDIERSQAALAKTMMDLIARVKGISEAALIGDLSARMDASDYSGEWRVFALSINRMLDAILGPVVAQAKVLREMGEGRLTLKITEDFKGEHNNIRDAVNLVGDAARAALSDFDTMLIAFNAGDLNQRADLSRFSGDWLLIMRGLNLLLDRVAYEADQSRHRSWVDAGLAQLSALVQVDMTVPYLCCAAITHLANYVDALIGDIYVWDESALQLQVQGRYACNETGVRHYRLGEGLIGQVALSQKTQLVSSLPDNYLHIGTALGQTPPSNLILIPVIYDGRLMAVIELASLHDFDSRTQEFLHNASGLMGMILQGAQNYDKTQLLLIETRSQAETLQQQQEELQQSLEELTEQSQALLNNEGLLRAQQEELHQTNAELEERTQLLESQAIEISQKNDSLIIAQAELSRQTETLAVASKYKSEFLANMSHELRTPLNSMLLLSRTLADNREGNMSDKQVNAARVMYNSGNDLLGIINDILDLSKIESGRELAILESVELEELLAQTNGLYQSVAEDRGLRFTLTVDRACPDHLVTDRQRLGQILRNLLSNAFKFTHQGGVTLRVEKAGRDVSFEQALKGVSPDQVMAFSIIDTGVGIPAEKQKLIWEAFLQADGTTSREYGGTGLGLTISRELSHLLGGEIHLVSDNSAGGVGSCFTLYLPLVVTQSAPMPFRVTESKPVPVEIPDDRDNLSPAEGVILIVEDDPVFAQILADRCRENALKYVACASAETALELLARFNIVGVLLDMMLPDKDGWSVLTRIKQELDTLHIPVYVISADERARQTLFSGAVGFVQKPVSSEQLIDACNTLTITAERRVKKLLIVEDDAALRQAVHELLASDDLLILEAGTGKRALEILAQQPVDLIILDLGLPDMTGFALLEQIRSTETMNLPPVIVFTGCDLTRAEFEQLQRYAAQIIIKGVRSDERLVEEVALFLHRTVANLPDRAKKMLRSIRDQDALFDGKLVLLVDDDMRNLFSLSGLLEDRGLRVITAKNGQEALDKLIAHPLIDIMLTDIMMPIMDGFELIPLVRKSHGTLPILALTAKAMKADRDRCIALGASDYLSKPIDFDRLIAVMRVWLYR